MIEAMEGVRAEDVSEMSHSLVGWLVADEGDTIPYNTIYFANPPLSEEEKLRARELRAAKARPEGVKDAERRDSRTA
jgi:hypothetical protein